MERLTKFDYENYRALKPKQDVVDKLGELEEKERYCSVIDCNEDFVIRDCESNQTCKSLFEVKTLLNYQNREINRLTKMLYTTTKHADKLNEENNKLNKENQKLKKQLKSQPAEIVEKIKKSIRYYPISLLDGDNEPRIKTLGISKEVLDNLLQEYQK